MINKRFYLFIVIVCGVCLSCSKNTPVENALDSSINVKDNHENISIVENASRNGVYDISEIQNIIKIMMNGLAYIGSTQAVTKDGKSVDYYFIDKSQKMDYYGIANLLYKLVVLYPSLDLMDDRSFNEFKSGLQFDMDRINRIMFGLLLLSDNLKPGYISAIIVDGLSSINGEESIELSIGKIDDKYFFRYGLDGKTRYMRKRDNMTTFFRVAVTKSGKIYLYQGNPFYLSKYESEFEAPVFNYKRRVFMGIDRDSHSLNEYTYSPAYYLGNIQYRIMQASVGQVMQDSEVSHIAQVVPQICGVLKRLKNEDLLLNNSLNTSFGSYELSVNQNIDCVKNNSIWIEDDIEFNGQWAYQITHTTPYYEEESEWYDDPEEDESEENDDPKESESDEHDDPEENESDENDDSEDVVGRTTYLRYKTLSSYLVTEDRTIFAYHYEPVYLGTLDEFDKIFSIKDQIASITPLFEMDNLDRVSNSGMGAIRNYHTFYTVTFSTTKNCRYDSSLCLSKYDELFDHDVLFDYIDGLSFDSVKQYIIDNYIGISTDEISSILLQTKLFIDWEIYFSENIQYKNEEAYDIYVGFQKPETNNLIVMTRYVITQSGKVYQADASGNLILKGNIH